MSDTRKTVYNVMKTEKYIGSDKKERTNYFQVGVAFQTSSGNGLSIKLAPDITVSGDLLIMERTAKGADQGGSGPVDDDIPL